MALISCRECTAEVSDSAPHCPRCGVSSPAGLAVLAFVRPQSGLKAIVAVEVAVDGLPQGRVAANDSLTVAVAPGNHHVEVVASNGRSAAGTVTAAAGLTPISVEILMLGILRLSAGATQVAGLTVASADGRQTPSGWYPDGQGNRRWWDGAAWTPHVEPAQA